MKVMKKVLVGFYEAVCSKPLKQVPDTTKPSIVINPRRIMSKGTILVGNTEGWNNPKDITNHRVCTPLGFMG